MRRRKQVILQRVFTGIDSPHDEEAVLALATLLERIEHASPEDRPGCATLEKRGLDTAERERLSRLLAVARAFTPVAVDVHAPDRRIEELVALYEWHADWAKTARAKIRDRNLLAALGIARKKWRTPASSSESTDT